MASEDVLRRPGPAKATVVDVVRASGVSHAADCRHSPSKAELREAVTRRWWSRSRDHLAAISTDQQLVPPERLRTRLGALFTAKRARAADDPELFATYRVLAAEHSDVVTGHLAVLTGQLRGTVADGVASGDFAAPDPAATAQALSTATTASHHPDHAAQ